MYNVNGLTFELITENGNKITEFNKDGLTYVEGRKGSKYKIRVTNNTPSRIKAIISVDGLDIITGKRAMSNGGGYVIDPYATQIFNGWRINDNEVREFFFTNQKNSYNAKTGNDTNNLGVIGVVAYKEYISPTVVSCDYLGSFDSGRRYSIGTAYGASGFSQTALQNSVSQDFASIGTGMGAVKESKVQTVHLNWESIPFAACSLYYKSRKELESMGIVVAPIKSKPLPSAFGGYCQQV